MEMLNTREREDVLNKLKQIVMLGRQAGFLILACQRPTQSISVTASVTNLTSALRWGACPSWDTV